MHFKIRIPDTGAHNELFGGNSSQRGRDEASDICKAGNIHNTFRTETKFTGDFKQSI